MKVKILKPCAGVFHLAYFGGEVADLDQNTAKLLIEAGFAEQAKGDKGEIETPEDNQEKETATKNRKK